jgi:hypothetical protein
MPRKPHYNTYYPGPLDSPSVKYIRLSLSFISQRNVKFTYWTVSNTNEDSHPYHHFAPNNIANFIHDQVLSNPSTLQHPINLPSRYISSTSPSPFLAHTLHPPDISLQSWRLVLKINFSSVSHHRFPTPAARDRLSVSPAGPGMLGPQV